MLDVMLDLETLGTRAGCVVLAIGAVAFDPLTAELGAECYEVINLDSSLRAGLVTDPATEAWWEKQSCEARRVLNRAASLTLSKHLVDALTAFDTYLQDHTSGPKAVRLWGNGSDFDQPILAAAYHAAGLEPPWRFWNNRCYRTLKSLVPDLPLGRTGTHHHALDDAITQARHAAAVMQRLVYHGGPTWPDLKQRSSAPSVAAPSVSTALSAPSSAPSAAPGGPIGSSGCLPDESC